MKLEIDNVLNPQAAGEPRATFMIVPGDPAKKTPPRVAFVVMGEGKTIRMMLETAEARAIGEMALVCGCVAEGGTPPTATPPPPFVPHILGGRH